MTRPSFDRTCQEATMGDLLYPLGTLAFFGLMLGYVRAIRGLGGRTSAEPDR
jgi:hypothetical protein